MSGNELEQRSNEGSGKVGEEGRERQLIRLCDDSPMCGIYSISKGGGGHPVGEVAKGGDVAWLMEW